MPKYLEANVDKFIFKIAADRLYSAEGVWVSAVESGGHVQVRIGLTDYVQQLNGDVAFVHVKPRGTAVAAQDELAEVETIKTNISVYSPIGGSVVEVNQDLDLSPEFVNQEPYARGWIAVLEATNWEVERAQLLDPQAYLATMRSQAEAELKK